MKSLLVVAFTAILSATAFAERTVLENGAGSVQLPPGYVSVEKPGGILRPKDAKNAIFTKGEKGEGRFGFWTDDQGRLATYPEKFPERVNILLKWSSEVNGHKIDVLVNERKDKPDQGMAAVSYPDLKVDFGCDYSDKAHLANFLFVALSYKPAEEAAPTPEKRQSK